MDAGHGPGGVVDIDRITTARGPGAGGVEDLPRALRDVGRPDDVGCCTVVNRERACEVAAARRAGAFAVQEAAAGVDGQEAGGTVAKDVHRVSAVGQERRAEVDL